MSEKFGDELRAEWDEQLKRAHFALYTAQEEIKTAQSIMVKLDEEIEFLEPEQMALLGMLWGKLRKITGRKPPYTPTPPRN